MWMWMPLLPRKKKGMNKMELSQYMKLFETRTDEGKARIYILVSEALKAVYTALTTGVFLTGFLLAGGLRPADISIVTSIPLVAGILYPIGSLYLERFQKRRVVLGIFRLLYHSFNIFLVTVLPFFFEGEGLGKLLIFTILLGNVANVIVASGFPAWHIHFLPDEIRGRFFSVSGIMNSIFTALASLAASMLSDLAASSGNELFWLGCVRGVAFLLALLELTMLLLPKEFEYPRTLNRRPAMLWEPAGHPDFVRTMVVVFAWMALSTMTLYAANSYLLDEVGVSYTFLSVLQTCNIFVTTFVMPYWLRGQMHKGWFRVFRRVFFLFSLYPVMHAFVTERTWLWMLPVTILFYQAVLAGGNFCFGNMAYICTPKEKQTVYLSWHLTVVSLGSLAGQGTAAAFLNICQNSLYLGRLELSPSQLLLLLQGGMCFIFTLWYGKRLLKKLEKPCGLQHLHDTAKFRKI